MPKIGVWPEPPLTSPIRFIGRRPASGGSRRILSSPDLIDPKHRKLYASASNAALTAYLAIGDDTADGVQQQTVATGRSYNSNARLHTGSPYDKGVAYDKKVLPKRSPSQSSLNGTLRSNASDQSLMACLRPMSAPPLSSSFSGGERELCIQAPTNIETLHRPKQKHPILKVRELGGTRACMRHAHTAAHDFSFCLYYSHARQCFPAQTPPRCATR